MLRDWSDKAACKNDDTEMFFPLPGGILTQANKDAIEICSWCPVKLQCLQFALDEKMEHGIWGGLIAEERKTLARRVKRMRRQITELDIKAAI
jgi:WhiB family redox-sensing transcriptional regulator